MDDSAIPTPMLSKNSQRLGKEIMVIAVLYRERKTDVFQATSTIT